MSSIPSGALRLGSHGKRVADLQRELGAAGFDPGAVDGAFGQHTAMALKAFQRAKNLAVDGVAGSQTWSALGGDRFDSSPSVRPAPAAGPPASGGKQVTAYVSGQARTITVVPVGNGG